MPHERGVGGAHEREVISWEERGEGGDGGEAERLGGRGESGSDVGVRGGEEGWE